MKSVLISILPQWVEKIASGKKTIDVRKTAPKEVPFKAYIYCSYGDMKMNYYLNGRGKVIGEFVCDSIEDFSKWEFDYSSLLRHINLYAGTNGDYKFLDNYLKGEKYGYGWHISDLKIYDKPKEVSEFNRPCSYAGLCFSCDRAKFTSKGDRICQAMITRPPQSYMFVEEVEQ